MPNVTRLTRSCNVEYLNNQVIKRTHTFTVEGTVFPSGNIVSAVNNFVASPSIEGIDIPSGYKLTNITVTAERTWFDYVAEYQKEEYAGQATSQVTVAGYTLYDATITDNPPKPRTVKIYVPNMDGVIVQKFGMSEGVLSIAGVASGYFDVSIRSTVNVQISESDQRSGVVESCSVSYDPRTNTSQVNLSIVYQPDQASEQGYTSSV